MHAAGGGGLDSFVLTFEGRRFVMVKDYVFGAALADIVFVSRPRPPWMVKACIGVASFVAVAVLSAVLVPPLFEEPSPPAPVVQSYSRSKRNHPFLVESNFPMQVFPWGMFLVAIFFFAAWRCDRAHGADGPPPRPPDALGHLPFVFANCINVLLQCHLFCCYAQICIGDQVLLSPEDVRDCAVIEGAVFLDVLYTGEFDGNRQRPFLQRVSGAVIFGPNDGVTSAVTSIQWHGETRLDIGRKVGIYTPVLELLSWTRPTDIATTSRLEGGGQALHMDGSRTGIAWAPMLVFIKYFNLKPVGFVV